MFLISTKVLSIKEKYVDCTYGQSHCNSKCFGRFGTEAINGTHSLIFYYADNKGRITRWAAMAIKAKIYLFEGNWTQVKNITSTIMTEGGFETL